MEDSKRMGYSFWGYMADVKLDPDGNMASTPDGNAAYSWAAVKAFRDMGYETVRFGIDRDALYVDQCGMAAFSSFATGKRWRAYNQLITFDALRAMTTKDYALLTADDFIGMWELDERFTNVDFILHEWRMTVPGRNDEETRQLCLAGDGVGYTPDLVIQDAIVRYCRKHRIPLVVFDLDYKLTEEQYRQIEDIAYVIELGNKWPSKLGAGLARKVFIPFDREEMLSKSLGYPVLGDCVADLIYVGNQYERDDVAVEMLGGRSVDTVLCGKWDPAWLKAHGMQDRATGRIQTFQIGPMYRLAPCTVLLAKDDYYRWNFMTARIVEAVYWGCVPLFPVDTSRRLGYKNDVVWRYLKRGTEITQMALVSMCCVRDGDDLAKKVGAIRQMISDHAIEYDMIRGTLRLNVAHYHDCHRFADEVINLVCNGRLNDAVPNV